MPTGAQADLLIQVLIWGGLGVFGLIILVLFVAWARRRLLGGSAESAADILNLETLDRLRAEGAIDEREYRALRSTAVRVLKASLDDKLGR